MSESADHKAADDHAPLITADQAMASWWAGAEVKLPAVPAPSVPQPTLPRPNEDSAPTSAGPVVTGAADSTDSQSGDPASHNSDDVAFYGGSEETALTESDAAPSQAGFAELNFCQNCGAPLAGAYCGACGQKDDDIRRPVQTFVADMAEGLFSLDGRTIPSLTKLIFSPGGLTRDYVMGKRARYTAPLRLYFAMTVLFFVLIWALDIAILDIRFDLKDEYKSEQQVEGQAGAGAAEEPATPTAPDTLAFPPDGSGQDAVDQTREEIEAPQAPEVDVDIDDVPVPTTLAETIAEEMRAAGSSEDEIEEALDRLGDAFEQSNVQFEEGGDSSTVVFKNEDGETIGEVDTNGFPYEVSVQAFVRMDDRPRGGLREEDMRRLFDNDDMPEFAKDVIRGFSRAIQSPDRFNNLFNTWLPRVMFILVPVFALFLRVFHWGRQRYYMQQLVFSLHFHSFLFLLLTFYAVVLPYAIIDDVAAYAGLSFWAITSIYFIVALKNGEQQSWLAAIFKAGFLYVSYFVVLIGTLTWGILEGLREL